LKLLLEILAILLILTDIGSFLLYTVDKEMEKANFDFAGKSLDEVGKSVRPVW